MEEAGRIRRGYFIAGFGATQFSSAGALDLTGGNISETARSLGLTRRGLYLKLRRLGLDSRPELDTH